MINLQNIIKASKGFDNKFVYHTPLEFSQSLSEKYNANIYLKREDLQQVRSYKIR
jgi:threonine dehydratase